MYIINNIHVLTDDIDLYIIYSCVYIYSRVCVYSKIY